MRKRVLSLFLAVVLLLGLLPTAALGAGQNAVTITFSYSQGSELVIRPKQLTVTAGLAEEYGFANEASGADPTVLDAVVAAHEEKYGQAFTKENATQYLDGTLTKIFENSGYAGHIINGKYSAELASQAVLHQGDVLDTLLYDDSYGDSYAAFYQGENLIRAISCKAGETFSLSVQGFNIMSAYEGEKWVSMDGMQLAAVDESGVETQLDPATDGSGAFTASFQESGTYLLMTKGAWKNNPVVPAWCTVTVEKGVTEEEAKQFVQEDFAELTLPERAENNITLPTKGKSNKTTIAWNSSAPNVISEKGVVVKQLQEQTVTLTATITCGTIHENKTFSVTVLAMEQGEITSRLNAAKKALLAVNALDPIEYSGKSGGSYAYEGSVAMDTNLQTKAQGIVDPAAPGVAVALKSVTNGKQYIAEDGTIQYPDGSKPGTAEVTFTLTLGSEPPVDVLVAGIKIPTHAETKEEAVSKKLAEVTEQKMLNGQQKDHITKPLKLDPGDSFGISVAWNSNHGAIEIDPQGKDSATGRLHKIIRPAYGQQDAQVQLTATIDYADTCKQFGICEAGPMPELKDRQRSFSVTVPAYTKEEWEALQKEIAASLEGIIIKNFSANGAGDPAANLEAVTEDLMLPNITGCDTVWTSEHPNIQAPKYKTGRAAVTRPAGTKDVTGNLVVTVKKGSYTTSKTFAVTVKATGTQPEGNEKLAQGIENISAVYAAKDALWWGSSSGGADWWHAVAMGAVGQHHGNQLKAEQKQAFANRAIASAAEAAGKIGGQTGEESTAASGLSSSVLGLSALGFDPEQITTLSNTSLAAGSALNKTNLEGAKKGWFSTVAPYVLLALQQGTFSNGQLEGQLVDYLLSLKLPDGGWGWSTTGDGDTTAMIIQGLSTSSREDAQKACVGGVDWLAKEFKNKKGSTFGNANTDAMVILALAAMGINPDSDARFTKGEDSLVDGFLSYLTPDGKGFQGPSGEVNDFATKQGLLALVAAEQVAVQNKPFQAFDFTGISKIPVKATDPGEKPVEPPVEGETITVSVTIQADTENWLSDKHVTVSKGSNVCTAFVKALEGTGITQVGAEKGYIRSISKDGKTLEEFGAGPNSGWLYEVDGKRPSVGITSYTLSGRENIRFYYTKDWTSEPGSGDWGEVAPSPETPVLTPGGSVNSKGEATITVKNKDLKEAIAAAEKKGEEQVIIVPKVDGTVKQMAVELPKVSLRTVSKTTVVIRTPQGQVDLPSGVISSVTKQAEGDSVTVTVAARSIEALPDQTVSTKDGVVVEVTITSAEKEIHQFGGEPLTLMVPVSKGKYQEREHYQVTSFSSDGSVEKLDGLCQKWNGTLGVQVKVPHLSLFLVTPNRPLQPLPFTDMTGHWGESVVQQAYTMGLMDGVSQTTFAPDNTLTRAMSVTILYRLAGKPVPGGEDTFTDVSSDQWYSDAIAWANQLGIVEGVAPGRFAPASRVTREQLAVLLYRYAHPQGVTGVLKEGMAPDQDEIAPWAREAMAWAVREGILKGRPDGKLDPTGTATRAEAAALFVRFSERSA